MSADEPSLRRRSNQVLSVRLGAEHRSLTQSPSLPRPETPLPSPEEQYRDILAFETRIQSNWRKKSRNRTRWLRAVYCLAALMAYCVYSLMSAESSLSTTQNMTPSSEKAEDQASWHGWTLTLLVSLLLSAFASGILSSRLSAPSDFLSRANRSCAPYQVSFSTASGKAGGVLGFSRRIPSAFASGFYEYKRRILSHGYRAGPSIVIKETEEGEEE